MKPAHEVVSPGTTDPTPMPANSLSLREAVPGCAWSAGVVLRAIAASGNKPWFPSEFAAATGTPRDRLDEPLNDLRLAGYAKIDAWRSGTGQSYAITPEGEAALLNPSGFQLPTSAPPPPADPHPTDPPAKRPAVIDTRPPAVTPVLLALNLLWFAVGLGVASKVGVAAGKYLSGGSGVTPVLHRLGAVSGPALWDGDWWRLASCCFVHIGWIHLLVNMLALGVMGPLAELLWGRWRMLVIYAASGLAGSCLAMANHPESMLAGASGAIWGVQTSLLAWLLLFRASLPSDLVRDWFRRLGFVFLLNTGVSFLPGVSWEGHLGGGVAGFVAAGLLNAIRFAGWPRRSVAYVLLALVPVASVGGLVWAKQSAAAWNPVRQRAELVVVEKRAAEFNRDVAPLLDAVGPSAVTPVEDRAALLLARPPAMRRKATLAAVKKDVTDLRDKAETAGAKLDVLPAGPAAWEAHRDRARAFAAARERSLTLLLRMLDSSTVPDESVWAAWGESRRTADALWLALAPR